MWLRVCEKERKKFAGLWWKCDDDDDHVNDDHEDDCPSWYLGLRVWLIDQQPNMFGIETKQEFLCDWKWCQSYSTAWWFCNMLLLML